MYIYIVETYVNIYIYYTIYIYIKDMGIKIYKHNTFSVYREKTRWMGFSLCFFGGG